MSRWFRLALSLILTTITVGVTASPVADPVSIAVLVGEEWLGRVPLPQPSTSTSGGRSIKAAAR
jgi:hypothetical protein